MKKIISLKPAYDTPLSDYSAGPAEGSYHKTYPPERRLLPASSDAERRFLILRLSSIGDVVMSSSAAREIKRRYPGSLVVAAVEEKSETIARMNPYLDEVFLFRVKEFRRNLDDAVYRFRDVPEFLRETKALLARLRGYSFDAAIDLQGMFRSGSLALASGARKRIGFNNPRDFSALFLTDKIAPGSYRRPGEEALHLLKSIGVDHGDPSLFLLPGADADRRAHYIFRSYGLNPCRTVALCPATTHPAKHWTEAGWAELSDLLREKLNLQPVFLGGPSDKELIERIASRTRIPDPSLAGMTSLEESAACIRQARLTISVDTGLAHISVAVGTPAVILHGSTTYSHMVDEPSVSIVTSPDACGRWMKSLKRRNHCRCLSKIHPLLVLNEASDLLKKDFQSKRDDLVSENLMRL